MSDADALVRARRMPDTIQSLSRMRAGFALAALVLPLAAGLLFAHQEHRLDALADHGATAVATVTAISRDRGTTFYEYRVDGVEHAWDVRRDDAPFAPGQIFPITYLPEDPSFSRPIADRSLAAREAAHHRSVAWKIVLGLFFALGSVAVLAHRKLARMRAGAPTALADPRAYRRRIAVVGVVVVSLVGVVGALHARDALERGESLSPVVFAMILVVAIVGTIFFLAFRHGPEPAHARAVRVARWIVPLAGAVAFLRLLAALFGR